MLYEASEEADAGSEFIEGSVIAVGKSKRGSECVLVRIVLNRESMQRTFKPGENSSLPQQREQQPTHFVSVASSVVCSTEQHPNVASVCAPCLPTESEMCGQKMASLGAAAQREWSHARCVIKTDLHSGCSFVCCFRYDIFVCKEESLHAVAMQRIFHDPRHSKSLLIRGHSLAEPVETFVDAFAGHCDRSFDVMRILCDVGKVELLADLMDRHAPGMVLLVRVHKQLGVSQLLVLEKSRELFGSFRDAESIGRIDDKDDGVRVLQVEFPKRSQLALSADIPCRELDVLVLERLDVEADGRDRRHGFSEFEFVKERGFPRCVQANDEDSAGFDPIAGDCVHCRLHVR